VVTSAFTGQYRQIARKNPRLSNLIGLRRIRFMPGHVALRSETGVLERNIGFGAKGWIADWRLQGIWKLTRFESQDTKMRKLNLGSMRHAVIRNRPATFPTGSA
jgi:hypothetical protein